MIEIRQLRPGDTGALASFYNGLSAASKRTFRPLGEQTTVDACSAIVADNRPGVDTKFDLVALDGGPIVGWSFVWGLDSGEPTFGLAVADACHGRGLGAALMDRVLQAVCGRGLPKVFLTVVQDNEIAWKMYQKRGFVRYGEFVGQDGLPYFRMAAELSKKINDDVFTSL